VEVKRRRGTGYGDPLEAVTPHKRDTLRSVAEHYLYTRKPEFDTLRFDVIGILADQPEVRVTTLRMLSEEMSAHRLWRLVS
jgi:Holliday junction resolvase-like predicted endonuclease